MLFFCALFSNARITGQVRIFTEEKEDIYRYFNRLTQLKNKDTIKRITKVTTAM